MPVKKTANKKRTDEFSIKGDRLVSKIKELITEGNVRRISILNKEKKTIIELPLTLGVVGAVLAPVLAAIGALAALLTECTIKVERDKLVKQQTKKKTTKIKTEKVI